MLEVSRKSTVVHSRNIVFEYFLKASAEVQCGTLYVAWDETDYGWMPSSIFNQNSSQQMRIWKIMDECQAVPA